MEEVARIFECFSFSFVWTAKPVFPALHDEGLGASQKHGEEFPRTLEFVWSVFNGMPGTLVGSPPVFSAFFSALLECRRGPCDYSQMVHSLPVHASQRTGCGNRASACGVCGRLGSMGQGETLDAGGFAGGTTSMRRPNRQWTVMVYARAVIFTAMWVASRCRWCVIVN